MTIHFNDPELDKSGTKGVCGEVGTCTGRIPETSCLECRNIMKRRMNDLFGDPLLFPEAVK